jgi:hypothetical protein
MVKQLMAMQYPNENKWNLWRERTPNIYRLFLTNSDFMLFGLLPISIQVG